MYYFLFITTITFLKINSISIFLAKTQPNDSEVYQLNYLKLFVYRIINLYCVFPFPSNDPYNFIRMFLYKFHTFSLYFCSALSEFLLCVKSDGYLI